MEAYKAAQLGATDIAESHSCASQFFGGLGKATSVPNSEVFDSGNKNFLRFKADFAVEGRKGVNARVTFEFVTPIPIADLKAKKVKSGSQLVHITKVEKSP